MNDRLSNLIKKAEEKTGGTAKLAKKLGVPTQHVSNWKGGTRACSPTDRAILAGLVGEDATAELVTATLEREQGTRRGDLLGELLGERAAQVRSDAQGAADVGSSPAHAALNAIVAQLGDSDATAEIKTGILAVLGAFPPEPDTMKVKDYMKSFKTGSSPVFLRPCKIDQRRSATIYETLKCRATAARV